MEGYQTSTYGERIAATYDDEVERTRDAAEPDAAADFLAPLASGGRALELGIGTGRIAIPLVERGVAVDGVDVSDAMVEQLHAKPGGAGIDVAMGDIADVPASFDKYDLVFVVFSTFFGMLTQRDQVRSFANVARVLRPGGRFVIEAFVPDVARYRNGQHTAVVRVALDEVRLDVSRFDAVGQRVDAQHVHLRNGTAVELQPVSIRFAWPSELDLMAELAGLELEARHGGWHGEPFTAKSDDHVSVYVKPR